MSTNEPTYFKSSHSGGDGNCAEISFDRLASDGVVLLRHTKHRDVPPTEFTRGEWAAFAAGFADGEFELPQ